MLKKTLICWITAIVAALPLASVAVAHSARFRNTRMRGGTFPMRSVAAQRWPSSKACGAWWLECDPPARGLTRFRYPTYGNLTVGDCEFAAAADWETIVLDIEPPSAEVLSDYRASLATARPGAVMPMWESQGIDHVRARVAANSYAVSRRAVEYDLATHRAWLAWLYDSEAKEDHALLLDSANASGPVVVTWGKTLQMTWRQWAKSARLVIWPEVT